MKLALIADIHGNLPALEATLADIGKRSVDQIICLGDLIGKGPSSREVMRLCREHCGVVLQGNWDAGLYEAYASLRREPTASARSSDLWYINNAGPENIEYLGSLPHCFEIYLSGKLLRMFHAHPVNFNRYFAESPVEQRLELFEPGPHAAIQKQADVALYADIHSAYLQTINDKMLINVGSVGNPLDLTQASYVLLEGDEASACPTSLNVQFVRVPYDIDRAVALAKCSAVPDLEGYLCELTTATYFRRG